MCVIIGNFLVKTSSCVLLLKYFCMPEESQQNVKYSVAYTFVHVCRSMEEARRESCICGHHIYIEVLQCERDAAD